MSDLKDLHDLLDQIAEERPGDFNFTLHVMFTATDLKQALLRGEQYARALNMLRTDVDCYEARVSDSGDWSTAVRIYCLAPGPDPADVCLRRVNHDGDHIGPGHSDQWTDDEIPTAPDTIESADTTT